MPRGLGGWRERSEWEEGQGRERRQLLISLCPGVTTIMFEAAVVIGTSTDDLIIFLMGGKEERVKNKK